MTTEPEKPQEKWSEIVFQQPHWTGNPATSFNAFVVSHLHLGQMISDLSTLRAENEKLREALLELSQCDLNEYNCSSFEVANRRIRNIANRAILSELNGGGA